AGDRRSGGRRPLAARPAHDLSRRRPTRRGATRRARGARMSGRPAAFLDRDGTIIRDASYVRDPADVELLPGAADAIRRLGARGVAVVVITNQSGIARGWLSVADYESVRGRMNDLLRAAGATVDASYMCPHHPDVSGPC